MLHIFHPTKRENGRYIYHSPAFRRDEKKFEFYEKAEELDRTKRAKTKTTNQNRTNQKPPGEKITRKNDALFYSVAELLNDRTDEPEIGNGAAFKFVIQKLCRDKICAVNFRRVGFYVC